MASPFSVFRKHEKVLMVVLTGLAMFAFIIMDQLQPQHFPIILGFLGGAALFWALGSASGRGIPYAVAGGILGIIVGYFVPGLINRNDVVETNFGDLSRNELYGLSQRRILANQFVYQAQLRSGQPPTSEGFFGSPNERAVAQDWVLHHKADEMGIRLGEEAVFEFIKQLTGGRLTQEAFNEIRHGLKSSEDQIVDTLGYELEIDMVRQLAQPFQFNPPRQLFGQIPVPGSPKMPTTPEQYWDLYRRMAVQEQVAVAEIPVAAFIDPKAEPSQADLVELFEKYKEYYPNQMGPGEPGFRQPTRVQVAYFEAAYEPMAAKVPQPTEEEMRAYYESHRESFRKPEGPSFESELQDLMRKAGTDEDQPVAAPRPPDADAAPNAPGPALPDALQEAPQPKPNVQPPAGEGAASISLPGATEPVAFLQDEEAATAPKTEAAPAADAAPPATNEDKDDEAAPAAPSLPAPGDAAPPLPQITPKKVEYRSFEDVKDQIRTQLHEEKVREALHKKIADAIDFMSNLGQEYRPAEEGLGGTTLTPKKISAELKKYSDEHGLRYVVTPFLSEQDLAESEYPVAQMSEPQRGERAILPRLYEDRRELYYTPTELVRGLSQDRYALWKIGYRPQYVPQSYEEIKDQVVEQWRIQQALPKARERAESLAKSVKEGQGLTAALAGETVTGEKNGDPLVVRQSRPFSWYTRQNLGQMPFGNWNVQLSNIDVVDLAGPIFMQTVFEKLDVGQTGSAPNYPRTKFYVVQVTERDYAKAEEPTQLRQRFLTEERPFGQTLDPAGSIVIPSAYQMLLGQEQQNVVTNWFRRTFDIDYGVQFLMPPQDENQMQ